MSWTEPQQFQVGNKPTASDLNNLLGGNMGYVQNKQLFKVHATTARSYSPTSGSWAAAQFDAVDYDIGGPSGNGSAFVSSTVFKITQPGWWYFCACMGVSSSSSNVDINFGLRNNTTTNFIMRENMLVPSGQRTISVSGLGYFNFAIGSSQTVTPYWLPNDTTTGNATISMIQSTYAAIWPWLAGYWLRGVDS